uniref:Putative trypsin n=1 Tax=Culex tarsalis TaxID=7177 RepID=A0A1Q3FKL5_CULTA
MHSRLLEDESDHPTHPVKSWWFTVSKPRLAIVSGAAISATIIVIVIIAITVDSKALDEDDEDPPGTPLPRKCGQRTAESDWPWTVEIYSMADGPDWEHTIALGTLVNDRYVLSSAYELQKFEDSTLRVLLGETTFVHMVDDSYFENRVFREILRKEFIEHDSVGFGTNMVLLQMDKEVKFNGRIQPICLPWVHPEIPQQLTILPDEKDKLFSSSAHLVDYVDCFEIWFYQGFEADQESKRLHLCAKQSNSSEHCYALRGSPLLGVFHDHGKKRFVQYGIKHYGDCAQGLQIYSNVTHHMEWIREVVTRKDVDEIQNVKS